MKTLGSLVWYTVEQDVTIEHIDFCRNLLEAGVVTTMPAAPKTTDVFKRACTQANIDMDDGSYVTVPAGTNNDSVWRAIKYIAASGKEPQLFLGKIQFDKISELVTVEKDVTDVFARRIADDIVTYCARNATMLTGYSVREHIRKIVEREFMAVRIRQGIYFVSSAYVDQLERVEVAANTLGDGISLHTVSVEATDKHRNMLFAAIRHNVVVAAKTAILEIASVIESNQKISKERFAQFNNEYKFLTAQESLYGSQFGSLDVQENLDAVRDATHQVMGRIRV